MSRTVPGESDGETAEFGFEIRLGPARVLGPTPGRRPTRREEMACAAVGRRHKGQAQVFLALSAWRAARDHVAQDTSQELGGLLWGVPGQDGDEGFLEVLEARPATTARGGLAQLTFGHEAWQEMLQEQTAGRHVVGWYHSHPGFGVFFSEQDAFIQRHFFSQPWQIALVLDSVSGAWGLYSWTRGEIAPWTGFDLYAPQAQQAGLEEEAARLHRQRR